MSVSAIISVHSTNKNSTCLLGAGTMKSQENLQASLIMEKHQLGQLGATYRGEWRPAVKLSLACGLIVALLIAAVLGWGMILGLGQTPGEAAMLVPGISRLFV